ncbi:MAG: DUF4268 domain-containing protein [Burkholderiales bacterium]|nr:DUF4268 domain-containing protein [Burkholderiales bacterium]
MEAEGIEAPIGDMYWADIVARDKATGKTVVIENQYNNTDHSHLGQMITYGADLDADIGVWISYGIKEPHAKAVKWLNDMAAGRKAFFLLEVELIKIGNSPYAPVFTTIVEPANWKQTIKKEKASISKSDQDLLYEEFWKSLSDWVDMNSPASGERAKKRPPRQGNYYRLYAGSDGWVSLRVNANKGPNLKVETIKHKDTAWLEAIESCKDGIERAVDAKIETFKTEPDPDFLVGFTVEKGDCPIADRDRWSSYIEWLAPRALSAWRILSLSATEIKKMYGNSESVANSGK